MRWWEFVVPALIVVIGLAMPSKPLGHSIYALAGVLICAGAAWFALVLARRLVRFIEIRALTGSDPEFRP